MTKKHTDRFSFAFTLNVFIIKSLYINVCSKSEDCLIKLCNQTKTVSKLKTNPMWHIDILKTQ